MIQSAPNYIVIVDNFKFQRVLDNMDKIDITDIEEDDFEDEEELDDEIEDEEYEDESEEEKIENERYEQYANLIKQKTDRELIESISVRLFSLETDIKHIRDDLVDLYNLVLENQEID